MQYSPSAVTDPLHQATAEKLVIGQRLLLFFFFFFKSIYIPECKPKAKTGRRLATVRGGVRR